MVVDFLCLIFVNFVSSWGQMMMNSLVFGGVGMVLCGFSEKYMFVFVDGQCVVNYVQLVNFIDMFFDVNVILLNMVECVEIVKIGVVFVYGLDVIVGVVNIIMKKNFQGLQIDG